MKLRKRPGARLISIALAVILLSGVPGCGGEGDPMKASDGTPRKTPSEVLKEATAKTGTPSPKP